MSLSVVGCSGGDKGTAPNVPVTIASVTLTPTTATLMIGTTASLSAAVIGSDGKPVSNPTIAWASESPAVATVTGNGTSATVTAVGAGSATIRASAGSVSGSTNLTVTPPPVARVSVSLAAAAMLRGDSVTATAKAFDAGNAALTGRSIGWASSNPAVASVSGAGVVHGVARGAAYIRATAEGRSDSVAVTVLGVRQVTISPDSVSARPATTTTLAATVAVDSGVSASVSWRSLNPVFATVSSSGVVSALVPGTARIEVRSAFDSTVRDTAVVLIPDPCAALPIAMGFPVTGNYEANDCEGTSDIFKYSLTARSVVRFELSGTDAPFLHPIDTLGAFGTPLGPTDRARYAIVPAGNYTARVTRRDDASIGNSYQLSMSTVGGLPACGTATLLRDVDFVAVLNATCANIFTTQFGNRPGMLFNMSTQYGKDIVITASSLAFPVYLEIYTPFSGRIYSAAPSAGAEASVTLRAAAGAVPVFLIVSSPTSGAAGKVVITIDP